MSRQPGRRNEGKESESNIPKRVATLYKEYVWLAALSYQRETLEPNKAGRWEGWEVGERVFL